MIKQCNYLSLSFIYPEEAHHRQKSIYYIITDSKIDMNFAT
jgi:hypothetical protein